MTVELAAVLLRTRLIPHPVHNNPLILATYKFKVHSLNRLERFNIKQSSEEQPNFVMKLSGVIAFALGAGIGEVFRPHHSLIPGI